MPYESGEVSTIVFCDTILLAGKDFEKLLRYDYELNRFKKMMSITPITYKCLFVAENRCHLICGTQSYYISGINDPFK